jgi:hypothetical protein
LNQNGNFITLDELFIDENIDEGYKKLLEK